MFSYCRRWHTLLLRLRRSVTVADDVICWASQSVQSSVGSADIYRHGEEEDEPRFRCWRDELSRVIGCENTRLYLLVVTAPSIDRLCSLNDNYNQNEKAKTWKRQNSRRDIYIRCYTYTAIDQIRQTCWYNINEHRLSLCVAYSLCHDFLCAISSNR